MRVGRKWLRLLTVFLLISLSFIAYEWYEWNRDNEWNGWGVSTPTFPQHTLCVLIPFRDRDFELSSFAPHMEMFLKKQRISHVFIVLNQTDQYRFNRAALINVGWFEADRIGCDYIVMHDVDLLPLNDGLSYGFPGDGTVRHISAPPYHPKYNYQRFVGGILMLTMVDFKRVNGMSNKYWGWGLEDDEFFLRIRDGDLVLERPQGLLTDKTTTFRHVHGHQRRRDFTKKGPASEGEKREKRRRDINGGLSTSKYRIAERTQLQIEAAILRVLHIELHCDLLSTPYCVSPS